MAKKNCFDCGGWLPGSKMYMVIDPRWLKYGAGKDHLCISSFEDRVGRALVASGFLDCMANSVNKEVAKRIKG